ncbi:hypothetical protein XcuCFBP2542_04715 [Xanthomonas cucurbitae]|uniref:Uncharacterized protein n=1 Tax=Xanthomonas cucurbitae TaxID=56453 RepID=A0A2S7DVG6_9XANT|nr:hypothetical protein XcuCFBP2542_04715 [Xanthomonas cucurbitae]QHG88254.1 hypothetical protein EBN15_16205 [Xanthomonas cucurbitae]WDM79743.1 hypothetical protein K6980_03125 [Xanthomonas cucurbitae]
MGDYRTAEANVTATGSHGGLFRNQTCARCSRYHAVMPTFARALLAQAHLQAFYAAHALTPVSSPSLQDRVPHPDLLRPAGAASMEPA